MSIGSPGAYLAPGQWMQAALSDLASPRWAPRAPWSYFQYCNLNFGVLASIIEREAGTRFRIVFAEVGA